MDRYAAHGWFINDLHRHILPYSRCNFSLEI
jgi:hypothetical protein